jgi:hypothetical protein
MVEIGFKIQYPQGCASSILASGTYFAGCARFFILAIVPVFVPRDSFDPNRPVPLSKICNAIHLDSALPKSGPGRQEGKGTLESALVACRANPFKLADKLFNRIESMQCHAQRGAERGAHRNSCVLSATT